MLTQHGSINANSTRQPLVNRIRRTSQIQWISLNAVWDPLLRYADTVSHTIAIELMRALNSPHTRHLQP